MKQVMKRALLIFLITLIVTAVLVAVFLGLFAFLNFKSVDVFEGADSDNRILKLSDDKQIRIVFVGDIMLSRRIGSLMVEQADWRYPFLKTASTTRTADIAFANLENPVSSRGRNVGSKYSFRANPESLKGLKYAGFDVVSLANNHINDYGAEAIYDTFTHLESVGIYYAGAGKDAVAVRTPAIIETEGQRVAFLAYTNMVPPHLYREDARPAVAPLDLGVMRKDIRNAKQTLGADFVVVSAHWGVEYQDTPRPQERTLAHALIDAGADMVIGHHPHTIQQGEWYNGGYIAYSLGNFVFDQNFSKATETGEFLTAVVEEGELVSVNSRKVRFTKTYQPYFID